MASSGWAGARPRGRNAARGRSAGSGADPHVADDLRRLRRRAPAGALQRPLRRKARIARDQLGGGDAEVGPRQREGKVGFEKADLVAAIEALALEAEAV